MQFSVPPFFKEKIAEVPSVASAVNEALEVLFPWFLDNKLYFFPEFTDHGVDHINTVLATAESLISPQAKSILTAEDAGAIILSVLLHDCAMHISWDGFQTLLSGEYKAFSSLLPENSLPWPNLFQTFMHSAKRWDQRKILQVVGAIRPIKNPPSELSDVTEVDKRVIGEFLRIHHARLAHEIALIGIPGPLEEKASWITPLKGTHLPSDLIGFIARSHNLSIRRAKDKLPATRRREFSKIHAPYVMAILRISDYLQIQSKRAHPTLLSIRKLSSSISISEWKKHAATVDIHPHGDDPEALVVHTEPVDVSTLFSLRSLFSSMQQELDATWACLGEVYGRHTAFKAFAFEGLTIRRLQTNVDDLSLFEKEARPEYLPIEMRLKSAGADMFALLVDPLYDGDATVGIRELVQNAVDACNEREAIDKKNNKEIEKSRVTVKLVSKKEKKYLIVSDNGIGMTLSTIRDYFLVAGASFRRSGWWRENFMDDHGQSTIQRSGRFGVGALASFLIGPQTHVITRHADEPTGKGIEFKYSINDQLIEARFVNAAIGTTIEIEIISNEVFNSLKPQQKYTSKSSPRMHWFALSTPEVACEVIEDDEKTNVNRNFLIPSASDELDKSWREFSHSDFLKIHWSFKKFKTSNYDYEGHWLICNGILIKKDWQSRASLSISPKSPSIALETPTISVFDPNGLLPLNLARNDLAKDHLPFLDELQDSMAEWYTDTAIQAWDSGKTTKSSIEAVEKKFRQSSATYWRSNINSIFLHLNDGVCLADSNLISNTNFDRVTIIQDELLQDPLVSSYIANNFAGVISQNSDFSTKSNVEFTFRSILTSDSSDRLFLESFGRKIANIRIHCTANLFNISREKGRVPNYLFHGWTSRITTDNQRLVELNKSNDAPSEEITSLLEKFDTIIIETIYEKEKEQIPETHLSRQWKKKNKNIPYFLNK